MNVLNRQIFGNYLCRNFSGKLSRNFCVQSNLKDEIGKLVQNNKVVVFMKGNPGKPRCGFSNAVVQILGMYGVTYDSHDVLQNESIRNGVKEYSNWPTIPQVFINGKFIGGCDIMVQLHETGSLVTELQKAGIKPVLADAYKEKGKSDGNPTN